jgi:SAF domain
MSCVTARLTEPTSPRPRRLSPPSWLDVRLLLGVALVLASVLIGAKVVSSASHTYPRVAVRHDLAAGSVLTAGDVTLARVQLPDRGAGVYVTRLDDVIGKQLSRPVSAGELVPAGALGAVPAQTTVTVPLARGNAPDLRKGERIELWVSTNACSSLVVLPDVPVQAVHADSSGTFGGGADDGQDVVISVAPDLADRVIQALALDDAQLRAGVLVGSAADTGRGGTESLPDLDGCLQAR